MNKIRCGIVLHSLMQDHKARAQRLKKSDKALPSEIEHNAEIILALGTVIANMEEEEETPRS